VATKSTVAETGDKSATKSTVAHTVDFVAGFGDKSATTWIQQLVAVDIVANSADFVADMVDFVASVYGALLARMLWRQALKEARHRRRLLLVYLHCDEHYDTDRFCRSVKSYIYSQLHKCDTTTIRARTTRSIIPLIMVKISVLRLKHMGAYNKQMHTRDRAASWKINWKTKWIICSPMQYRQ